MTPVSGQVQKTSVKSDKILCFSYWTKTQPGAAPGKVIQVIVRIVRVSIISVTKCMELFLLDAVLGQDLLESPAVLLLPRRMECQLFF